MSGIDDYTRLYITFDIGTIPSGSSTEITNMAWASQAYYDSGTNTWYSLNPDTGLYTLPGNNADYPQSQIGQNVEYLSGVYGGNGFRIRSHEPTVIPTQGASWWIIGDRTNPFAVQGLYALFYGDYTIDFWVKVNSLTSDYQPIFTNASGWSVYYKDGVLYQEQGTSIDVSCACDLVGSFHHIELNRSLGVNRIFVDGVLQTLLTDVWNPVASSLYSFFIGCSYNTYRNVDLIIDEIRFSTGIARHTENFDVPTSHYTRPSLVYVFIYETGTGTTYSGYVVSGSSTIGQIATISTSDGSLKTGTVFKSLGTGTIASPTNATLLFSLFASNSIELAHKPTVFAIQDGVIRFEGTLSTYLEIYKQPFGFPIVDGKLFYEYPLGLDVHFYGLTVPAIQDGVISFDKSFELLTEISGSIITEIIEGTIYELIDNTVQIPMSLFVSIVMDAGTSVSPSYSFTFRNMLVDNLETDFSFLNALNADFELNFTFSNILMVGFEMMFQFPNKLLPYNELEKDFLFVNRLLGTEIFEEYDTFYFSERHGV